MIAKIFINDFYTFKRVINNANFYYLLGGGEIKNQSS